MVLPVFLKGRNSLGRQGEKGFELSPLKVMQLVVQSNSILTGSILF